MPRPCHALMPRPYGTPSCHAHMPRPLLEQKKGGGQRSKVSWGGGGSWGGGAKKIFFFKIFFFNDSCKYPVLFRFWALLNFFRLNFYRLAEKCLFFFQNYPIDSKIVPNSNFGPRNSKIMVPKVSRKGEGRFSREQWLYCSRTMEISKCSDSAKNRYRHWILLKDHEYHGPKAKRMT